MASYGSRGRLPLASELVRRLKPSVVADPLFGQTVACAISETLMFKYEVILFRKQNFVSDVEVSSVPSAHFFAFFLVELYYVDLVS